MAKTEKPETAIITREQSFAAFEKLLTVQQNVVAQVEAAAGNPVAEQVARLQGIAAMRDAFDDAALPAVLSLAGTPLGFRTDKDITGGGCSYPPEIVRDVALSAMISGLQVLGNQFNIIVGNLYVTNEGHDFLLSQLPCLSDIDVAVGNPEDCDIQEAPSNNGQYTVFTVYGFVPVVTSFKLFGVPQVMYNTNSETIDGRFQVSASGKDKLATVDSLKTKAARRAKTRLLEFARTAATPPAGTATPVAIAAPPPNVADVSAKTWAERFEEHGVTEPAKLIRDAPTAADRESVVASARKQDYSDEALALLEEYAATKSEQATG